MEQENITMQYISVWGWHLKAMMALFFAFLIVLTTKSLIGTAMFGALVVTFAVCEYISLKRKQRFEEIKE